MYWLRWHYHVKDVAGAPYKNKTKRTEAPTGGWYWALHTWVLCKCAVQYNYDSQRTLCHRSLRRRTYSKSRTKNVIRYLLITLTYEATFRIKTRTRCWGKTHSSGGQSGGHDIRYPRLSCPLTSVLLSSLNGAAPVHIIQTDTCWLMSPCFTNDHREAQNESRQFRLLVSLKGSDEIR